MAVGVVAVACALVAVVHLGGGSRLGISSLSRLGQIAAAPGDCPASADSSVAGYSFERCAGSRPISWTRCSTITYSAAAAAAPPGWAADLHDVMSQAEAATHLHLEQVSTGGDITVTWDPTLYAPAPGTAGEAGVTEYGTETGLGGSKATSATIRVSANLETGSEARIAEEPVLLHEVGHALGLDHFDGPEVMNPVDHGYTTFQPGDLAGLAALYRPAGC